MRFWLTAVLFIFLFSASADAYSYYYYTPTGWQPYDAGAQIYQQTIGAQPGAIPLPGGPIGGPVTIYGQTPNAPQNNGGLLPGGSHPSPTESMPAQTPGTLIPLPFNRVPIPGQPMHIVPPLEPNVQPGGLQIPQQTIIVPNQPLIPTSPIIVTPACPASDTRRACALRCDTDCKILQIQRPHLLEMPSYAHTTTSPPTTNTLRRTNLC